ncbi:MAG: PAS domain S-box protein [Candidatus Thorarchaeota archaeon]|nr:PAS domain S-box protein [Candidatus Thorarchaeota archaeon]
MPRKSGVSKTNRCGAMRESYERKPSPDRKDFRRVADTMHIPVVEFDEDSILCYANAPALKLFNLKKEAIDAGVTIHDLVAPEQQALVDQGLKLLSNGRQPTSMSLGIVRGDGVKVPTQVYTDKVVKDGKTVGFLVYIIDLSRRVAAEEAVIARKEILEFMVDYYSFSGIIIVNDKYKFEYVNDKMCDILGRRRSEILGHDFREFLHPNSIDLVTERYQRRQKGETVPSVYEFQVVRKGGEVVDIRMNVGTIRGRDGKIKTVAQLIDITDEKRSAYALQESERRYRSLIETMDSGLGVDNADGHLVLANEALCRMMGCDDAETLIGMPITDILMGWTENKVHEKMEERKEGKIEHYEALLKHKSGNPIPVMVSASPLHGADGEFLGSIAIFTDISDQKKAEAEIYFLLDLLLHDIGNQLQIILAGGDFLEVDATPEQIMRSKRYVMDGALRCLELIQKVRKAEEAKTEPLGPVDIVRVIRAESELLFKQRGVRVSIGKLPSKLMVLADQALSQLVWNLLENAVVHNPIDDSLKQVKVIGKKSESTFVLSISDNGPGLSDDKKTDLFNPKRRYGGVGLHLVRRLAEKYGGTPEVKDRVKGKPDQGLKIVVKFRLA